MRLEIGNKAPSFRAESLSGETVSLEDYKNQNVLIKFYRFATCPVCNLHLRSFVRQYDKLAKAGLLVVVIFHSPKWRTGKNMPEHLPFEILSDPDKKIFKRYGVEKSMMGMFSLAVWRDYYLALRAGFSTGMFSHDGGMFGHPADMLVDKDGIIRYVHYGKDYADSLTVEQALEAAEKAAPARKKEAGRAIAIA